MHLCVCCETVGFGEITNPPENALLVATESTRTHLMCESDTADEIAWTYDGNTIINAPCEEVRGDVAVVFASYPKTTPSMECNINASLEEAKLDPSLRTISGPYGCTDRTNEGITETAMVIVLGRFHWAYMLFGLFRFSSLQHVHL